MIGYIDCSVKEAIEMWLHPIDFHIDMRFPPSHSWHPATDMVKEIRGDRKHKE
jgi:hypothetical protein